jgi:hypothetical protein
MSKHVQLDGLEAKCLLQAIVEQAVLATKVLLEAMAEASKEVAA